MRFECLLRFSMKLRPERRSNAGRNSPRADTHNLTEKVYGSLSVTNFSQLRNTCQARFRSHHAAAAASSILPRVGVGPLWCASSPFLAGPCNPVSHRPCLVRSSRGRQCRRGFGARRGLAACVCLLRGSSSVERLVCVWHRPDSMRLRSRNVTGSAQFAPR